MPTQVIVFQPVPVDSPELTRRPGPHLAVMKTRLLRKGSSLPALHPSRGHRRPINTTALDGDIPSDLFETLPPKELAGAGDMRDVREAIVIMTAALDEWRPRHAQSRVFGKFPEQELEIVRREGNVGVKTADDVATQVCDAFEPGIDTVDLRGEAPVAMFRHSNQIDPVTALSVFVNDLVCPVGRSVADNDPPHGRARLHRHRIERASDVPFLVPCRCNQHVRQF